MRMDGGPMDGGAVTAGRGSLSPRCEMCCWAQGGGGMLRIKADYWLRQLSSAPGGGWEAIEWPLLFYRRGGGVLGN